MPGGQGCWGPPGSPGERWGARLSGQGVREPAQHLACGTSCPPLLRASGNVPGECYGCPSPPRWVLLGTVGAKEPSCLGAAREWRMLWGPELVLQWGELSAARFALGVAGDAAGWAALGSRHSLFPSWEPRALLAPSCPAQGRDPLSCRACGAEVSPAAWAEVCCFHAEPCWVSSGASSVSPYRMVLGAGRGWGVEQLPAKSLMSMRGETEAHEGSRTCPRTILRLGMETSRALAQGLWPIPGAGCGRDPWDGSQERVPPTTWQAAGNSATA